MTGSKRPRLTAEQSKGVIRQAFAFLIVGGVSAVIDGGLYTLLVFLGVNPVLASPASFLTSVFFNYFGNRTVVFSASRPGTYWRYAVAVAFNVVLGTAIVAGGIALGLHPLLAKGVSMVVIVAFNFVILRTWVFRRPRVEPESAVSE